jgi:hypothetical protein
MFHRDPSIEQTLSKSGIAFSRQDENAFSPFGNFQPINGTNGQPSGCSARLFRLLISSSAATSRRYISIS